MDFFGRQAQARSQTQILILLSALALLLVLVLNYVILAVLSHPLLLLGHPGRFLTSMWNPDLAFWLAVGTVLSVTLGWLYKRHQLARGGCAVAELLGGRSIDVEPTDPDERKLRNVVEEMAIASGTPTPEIYVLDRERGINAFAAGHTRNDVAIGITFGALKLLTRDELQGVIAHEFSHILNGDTRLNMQLIALGHGFFWPTLVGRVLTRGTTQGLLSIESCFEKGRDPGLLPTAPIGILFWLLGSTSLPVVRWMKSAICRKRECLADAAAVQFTRNTEGLTEALKKIGGLLKQGRLDTPYAEAASHLYFVNSAHDHWFSFQATHPALSKRVLALDPSFNGQFKRILSVRSRDAEHDRTYEESVRRAREAEQRSTSTDV